MKLPALNLIQGHAAASWAVNGQQHFIPARRRRIPGAKTRGYQAIGITQSGRSDGEGNGVGGTTTDHRSAIKRKSAHSDEGRVINKQVNREEIGVLQRAVAPQRELRVIAELVRVGRINLQGVEVPASRNRIAGLRHTNALEKLGARKRRKGEVAH